MYSHETMAEMVGREIITAKEANAVLHGADSTVVDKKIADYYMKQPKVQAEYDRWLRDSLL
mgnify:FL=1